LDAKPFSGALPRHLRSLCLALTFGAGVLPATAQQASLTEWAERKTEELRGQPVATGSGDENRQFNEPVLIEPDGKVVLKPGAEQARLIEQTVALYESLIGDDSLESLVWSGLESGNPLTRDENYRWNSLADQGMFDAKRRERFIEGLEESGIRNIRVGLSNHLIDVENEESWSDHDALIRDISDAGLNISLDLHHFGIEDQFRVVDADGKTVGPLSYYLNPAWPDFFAEFAAKAFDRYNAQIQAVTLINEPETTVGFNSEMWHGAFPGWNSPQNNFYYIERGIQVAKAAVKARIALQKQMAGSGKRVLFVHPEAAVYKAYWADFNTYNRFFASDLILGHRWLLEADLDALASRPMSDIVRAWTRKRTYDRTSLDWVVENYVVYNQSPENHELNRKRLVGSLTELKALHAALARDYGVSMRTDTVFGVDYYAHNEDRDVNGKQLSPEPQHYAQQVKSGRRAGIYPVIVDYYNRYQIPVMIGETGTPYHHYATRWHQQILLECAQASADGVPFLGYSIYPAIDTWGWETALSVHKDHTLLNPGGVLSLALQPRPFIGRLFEALSISIPSGSNEAALHPHLLGVDPDIIPQLDAN
jgi:beta-glucosidase/6-phospho-beta-glucosidase/beta-galactosidase